MLSIAWPAVALVGLVLGFVLAWRYLPSRSDVARLDAEVKRLDDRIVQVANRVGSLPARRA